MSSHDHILELKKFIDENIYYSKEEVYQIHSLNGLFNLSSADFKIQLLRYEIQKNVIRQLVHQGCGDRFVVLKGMSFDFYHLYPNPGMRLTSDIDFLVESIIDFEDILLSNGFCKIKSHRWMGNGYKENYSKMINGLEIVVELHEKLFFHVDDVKWDIVKNSIGAQVFSKEDLFVHLVGHFGLQHTYLKLHWLLDIKLLLDHQLDFFKIEKRLKELKLERSWLFVKVFLELVFNFKKSKNIFLRLLCGEKFILMPERNFFRYQILKILSKDSFFDSLRYSVLWFYERGYLKS